MLNKCILIGRLTRDPESSYTASGIARTKFTLAVERGFTGGDGGTDSVAYAHYCWQKGTRPEFAEIRVI